MSRPMREAMPVLRAMREPEAWVHIQAIWEACYGAWDVIGPHQPDISVDYCARRDMARILGGTVTHEPSGDVWRLILGDYLYSANESSCIQQLIKQSHRDKAERLHGPMSSGAEWDEGLAVAMDDAETYGEAYR